MASTLLHLLSVVLFLLATYIEHVEAALEPRASGTPSCVVTCPTYNLRQEVFRSSTTNSGNLRCLYINATNTLLSRICDYNTITGALVVSATSTAVNCVDPGVVTCSAVKRGYTLAFNSAAKPVPASRPRAWVDRTSRMKGLARKMQSMNDPESDL